MLVSIVHRALGVGMALVGAPLLTWWLAAAAGGEESYASFLKLFTTAAGGLNVIGYVLGIGLTWAALQHMMTGIRHLVLDTGAGYELRRNKAGAMATLVLSAVLTLAYWAYIVAGR